MSISVTGLLLSTCALLSGCDDVAAPPGAKPAYGPPGAPVRGNAAKPVTSRPATTAPANKVGGPPSSAKMPVAQTPAVRPEESGALNPMGPMVKIEQAGNLVNLASEIIMAGVNPFMDRLPRASVVISDDGTSTPVADTTVPVDPFASVTLLGIAYSKTSPMALLAVSSGQAGQSQLVRKGEMVLLDGAQAKIINILPESVEFQLVGPVPEKRTLVLPNIVGYGATTDASSTAGAMPQENAAPNPQSAGPTVSTPTTGNVPNLPNLDRLAGNNGSSGSARATSRSVPNVTLHEP